MTGVARRAEEATPSIGERIDATWSTLPPQEQRAAAFLRSSPDESATLNSAEVARAAGVSKATVSRLYRRLGFADSQEARAVLRRQRAAGLPVVVDGGDPLDVQVAAAERDLRRLRASVDRAAFAAAVGALAAAPRVLVAGHRAAEPVAHQLQRALAQARDGVVRAEGGAAEGLVGLAADDVVVVVALRRRSPASDRLLDAAAAGPARVLAITDRDSLHGHQDWRLVVPGAPAGAFDSHASAGVLVAALADAVLAALGARGALRVAVVDAAARSLGELV